jgi:hypothetical protein
MFGMFAAVVFVSHQPDNRNLSVFSSNQTTRTHPVRSAVFVASRGSRRQASQGRSRRRPGKDRQGDIINTSGGRGKGNYRGKG